MNQTFEYYVTRSKNFEKATKWVKLYYKYARRGCKPQFFERFCIRYSNALDRLFKLI